MLNFAFKSTYTIMMADEATTKAYLDEFTRLALLEDVGEADHTSAACIPVGARSRAHLLIKDPGVLAGVAVAQHIFNYLDPHAQMKIFIEDGADVSEGQVAFELECDTQALLKGERLALNCMQRMSGIATMSNRFHFEVEDLPVKILDTRKTTPLLRFLEKWAVRLGGCENYRFGLYDWIMIKDNHIDACGGIQQAIDKVEAYQKSRHLQLGVTIEVRNLVELYEALEAGRVTRILLDNFEWPLLKEAVAAVGGRFETEASGGVDIHNVRQIAQTGVDYISVGALTHSFSSLDLSLKIVK